MITRRNLFRSAAGLFVAPAIIPIANLMPVKAQPVWFTHTLWENGKVTRVWFEAPIGPNMDPTLWRESPVGIFSPPEGRFVKTGDVVILSEGFL